MELLMYLRNDLIDSVSLERHKIILPGYISGFIRLLREKHDHLIKRAKKEPEFLVRDGQGPDITNSTTGLYK